MTSNDLVAGESMPEIYTAAEGNVSPHLTWSGFPPETKGFVVTCFDPDAPTPAGWWHWTILDIDSDVTELEQGAGESDLTLAGAAFHLRHDGGGYGYLGAAPPKGDVPHRYIFAVHALDVDSLELDEETTATMAAFSMVFHTIARGYLTVTFSH